MSPRTVPVFGKRRPVEFLAERAERAYLHSLAWRPEDTDEMFLTQREAMYRVVVEPITWFGRNRTTPWRARTFRIRLDHIDDDGTAWFAADFLDRRGRTVAVSDMVGLLAETDRVSTVRTWVGTHRLMALHLELTHGIRETRMFEIPEDPRPPHPGALRRRPPSGKFARPMGKPGSPALGKTRRPIWP